MLRNLLICGLLAGLCGGLLATGFARVVGERPRSTRRSPSRSSAGQGRRACRRGDAGRLPQPCRSSFGLLTAAVVYGLALGGLFALAFAAAYGRVGRASPARTSILMAAGAFVVLYLVPFVKYPANPPSVGDPDTIRQAHGAVPDHDPDLAAGRDRRRATARACWPSAGRARRRRWSPVPAYLLVVVVAGALLPSIHEVPKTFPAVTLFRFREASIGMQPCSGRRSASSSPARRSAS